MEGPRTPLSARSSIIPDTVARGRNTSQPSYKTGDLNLGKTAVIRDLDRIAVVPLDYFNTACLPPLHRQIDLAYIESSLCDNGMLSLDAGRWTVFSLDPEAEYCHEDVVFGRLSGVFDAIVQAASDVTSTAAKLKFVHKPTTAPTSERTNTSRPDAYLRLANKKSVGEYATHFVDCWDDIAVSFEFKKRNGESKGERADNEKKLIWSLHHIMRSDPCRRSTLGVTIENTQMRLWFSCRSVLVVSKPFNFITSTKQIIRLFCSLAFAEDHELGWDPTIQRVLVEGKAQYDISLQSLHGSVSIYRTTSIISDFGAEALRGRGTRVFEAYLRINSNGDPVDSNKRIVIKDSWRECDRKREDEIRAEIFSDLEKAKGTEAAEADMKYFLTVLQASDVTVDGKRDDTNQLLRYLPLPADCGWYTISPSPGLSRTRHTSSVGCPPSYNSHRHVPKPLNIYHRTHSRIVFEEVCTPLFELRDLDCVFATLGDGLRGLRILHSINWVHRDISLGNILRIGNQGKIADLEYAKRMGSEQSHEVRTGTLDFMACEVEAQQYLFKPPASREPFKNYEVESSNEEDSDEDIEDAVGDALGPPSDIPFTFNPLHDLESLWWIQAWILHFYVDREGRGRSAAHTMAYEQLFPGSLLNQARLIPLGTLLKTNALPKRFRKPAHAVEQMRRELVTTYIASEQSLPPKFQTHLDGLTAVFAEGLDKAATASKNVKLFEPGRRKLEEDEEEQPKKRSKT